MAYASLRTVPVLVSLLFSLLSAPATRSQDLPDSVDIDLRRSTPDTNSLEVYLRANGQPFGGVLSGLTFTIRWATTSPATLGPRVNACPAGINIGPTTQVTNPEVDGLPTGFNYRTYNAFGASLLSDEGCPLPLDTWFLVMTMPVENNTGCTEFNIVNDAFTDSPGNARDYYVALGGYDSTGTIEPTSAFIGVCAADCLGDVGGTALPGTPCDDGNPDTGNDLFNEECVCTGLPMGLIENAHGDLLMILLPNPSVNGSVLVHLEGITSSDKQLADIVVLDVLGKRVVSALASITGGMVHHRLDLGRGTGAGQYVVLMTIDGRRYSQRLVVL